MGTIWGPGLKIGHLFRLLGVRGDLIIWDVRVVKAIDCVMGNFSLLVELSPPQGESWWLSDIRSEKSFRKSWQVYMVYLGINGVSKGILTWFDSFRKKWEGEED